jgi:AraC-like DNA-binding protein
MSVISEEERLSDSPFVEKIWRTQSEQAVDFTSLASNHSEIVVAKYEGKLTVAVRGPETKATTACVPAAGEWFGIVLKLGAFIPPHLPKNLMDRSEAYLPTAGDNSFWLDSATWEIPTYENADTFVKRLIREELLVYDPIVDAVLQDEPHKLSKRAVQYRFVRATGLTHNTIQQIDRAKKAMDLLRQGASILDTGFEIGYFDQPHLTRSLKRFTGHTPLQIAHAAMAGSLLMVDSTAESPDSP